MTTQVSPLRDIVEQNREYLSAGTPAYTLPRQCVELLQKVKAVILAYPERYDQGEWCGTACCIAGHGVAIAMPHAYAKAFAVRAEQSFVCRNKEDAFELDPVRAGRLFFVGHWPEEFDLELCQSAAECAHVAAARIDRFIATGGME